MFSKIKDLQHSINRIGLGAALKSVPTPRMMVNEETGTEIGGVHEKFVEIINDKDILSISRDLFVSGFYSQAVEEAFKFVDNYIKRKSNQTTSGSSLMERVFSPNNPILKINALSSESETNEQAGYHRIFAGTMLGIRNPCAHENNWFRDPELALEAMVIAQHLLKKAKTATT